MTVCLNATLLATASTRFRDELEVTVPEVEGLLFGACELPNKKADKFGGEGLVVLALPGSDNEVLVGGCTIRGKPAGMMSPAIGIGAVTATTPGSPLSVCIS